MPAGKGSGHVDRESQTSWSSEDEWEDMTALEEWQQIFEGDVTLEQVFEAIDVVDYLKTNPEDTKRYEDYYFGTVSHESAMHYLALYAAVQEDEESTEEAEHLAFERLVYRLQRIYDYAQTQASIMDHDWEPYRDDISKLRSTLASKKIQHECGEALLVNLAKAGVISHLFAYTGRESDHALSGMRDQPEDQFVQMCDSVLQQLEKTVGEATMAISVAVKLQGNLADLIAMRRTFDAEAGRTFGAHDLLARFEAIQRAVAMLKRSVKPPPPPPSAKPRAAKGLGASVAAAGLMSLPQHKDGSSDTNQKSGLVA